MHTDICIEMCLYYIIEYKYTLNIDTYLHILVLTGKAYFREVTSNR